MSKITIGLLFIIAGILLITLSNNALYNRMVQYLAYHKWITPPVPEKINPNVLGRRQTIILYAFALIIIGIYLLWNHQA